MTAWSHCNDMATVTLVPLIPGDCDKCARVAGNSGFPSQGVGEGRGEWEIDNKASRENFLFFKSEHPLHIVKLASFQTV